VELRQAAAETPVEERASLSPWDDLPYYPHGSHATRRVVEVRELNRHLSVHALEGVLGVEGRGRGEGIRDEREEKNVGEVDCCLYHLYICVSVEVWK